jgi:hypothetical protein
MGRRLDEARFELVLDTSNLPAGSGCWLCTVFGLRYFPATSTPTRIEITAPGSDLLPGADRLLATQALLGERAGSAGILEELLSEGDDALQRLLAESPSSCGAQSQLQRLVLGAALQQPGGIRSLLFQFPALYYFEDPPPGSQDCTMVRLTLTLEPAGEH